MAKLFLIGFFLLSAFNIARGELVDRITVIVNNDIVTLTKLKEAMYPYIVRIQSSGLSRDQEDEQLITLKHQILDQLINEKLVDQQIQKYELTVSDKEIDDEVNRIKQARSFSDKEFEAVLASQGLDIESYRKQIKDQILRVRLVNMLVKSKIVITDSEKQSYYNEHIAEYQGKISYHLRTIRLTEPTDDILELLNQTQKQCNEGHDFKELAQQFPDSPFSSEGGDLGSYYLDQLAENIKQTVQELTPGKCSEVFSVDKGYQIIFLEEKIKEADRSYEDCALEIEEKLYNQVLDQKYQTWINELRARAYIKIID